MRVSVVALGKIGLPLAVQFADAGHEVVGVDVNQAVVESVNQGIEPFPGEAHLQEKLSDLVGKGRLQATTDFAQAIPQADVVVVVVPLFVNDETWQPDFGRMDAATTSIGKNLSKNTLICYETTLPVGTTRGRFAPMLQETSGLQEGSDFHVVFSPERVLTGRVFADLRRYPKLIGALSEAGAQQARAFYESALSFDERPDLPRTNGVWDMGSAEASEMAKLAETTYRDVNIGLANQFAIFADQVGIDVMRVIEACNSQPYSHIHLPGIAVGGHCIPVYPRLYLSTDQQASIVRTARQHNAQMPAYVVKRITEKLGELIGRKALILGAAYRGGVKETAFSGVFALVEALQAAGAQVGVQDPMFTSAELQALRLPTEVGSKEAEIVIIQADHAQYANLSPTDLPAANLIFDGRRVVNLEVWEDAGIPTLVIGR